MLIPIKKLPPGSNEEAHWEEEKAAFRSRHGKAFEISIGDELYEHFDEEFSQELVRVTDTFNKTGFYKIIYKSLEFYAACIYDKFIIAFGTRNDFQKKGYDVPY